MWKCLYISGKSDKGGREETAIGVNQTQSRDFFNLVFFGGIFLDYNTSNYYICTALLIMQYCSNMIKSSVFLLVLTRLRPDILFKLRFWGKFSDWHTSNYRNTLNCSSCSIAQMWSSSVYFSWCQSKQRFSSHTHQLEHITLRVMQYFWNIQVHNRYMSVYSLVFWIFSSIDVFGKHFIRFMIFSSKAYQLIFRAFVISA